MSRPTLSGEDLLDDADAIDAGDPGGMLRAVAAAPAQFREAAFTAAEVDLSTALDGGRPRAVVVAGMGGSGIAGDVLAAVAGGTSPVPVWGHRGYGLPGWVGAADLVVAVSCSGSTEETLTAAEEATRRGARLVTVGAADSPLADRGERGHAPHFVVPPGRVPRAAIWGLSVPLLVLGDRLGVLHAPTAALDAAAELLEALTERFRPSREAFLNPAKTLALNLIDQLPVVWGTSPLAGVAAHRCAGQLAENAKLPCIAGVLPEASHNQVVAFDGSDPGERLRLVLLRDTEEHPQVAKRAVAARDLATERGMAVDEIVAEGASAVERIASLIATVDFASVYLALLRGVDPTAMVSIDELKARIRE